MEIDSKKFADVQLNRVVSPLVILEENEEQNENPKAGKAFSGNPLRPQTFADYPGQEKVKNNLEIFVRAAKLRKHTLDHVLLHGPPGLGKTTLAHILANEMRVPFYNTSGPSIDKPGDLVGILMSLEKNSLLFIDEIHRLSIQVEEVLYSAMEDFYVDIIIGQGQASRSMRMDIAPFTLVGATTRVSLLSRPLQNRFGIQERLEFYRLDALVEIIKRNCTILDIEIDDGGALELAKRSRGTPRISNRLLKRVWDFAAVEGQDKITEQLAASSLSRLEIDHLGLDRSDRAILEAILTKHQGGPVGLDTLAATIGEERSTIEEVFEPYLVYLGFLARGPRGRILTELGRAHLQGK